MAKDITKLVAKIEQKQEVKEEVTNFDEQLKTLRLAVTNLITCADNVRLASLEVPVLLASFNAAKDTFPYSSLRIRYTSPNPPRPNRPSIFHSGHGSWGVLLFSSICYASSVSFPSFSISDSHTLLDSTLSQHQRYTLKYR